MGSGASEGQGKETVTSAIRHTSVYVCSSSIRYSNSSESMRRATIPGPATRRFPAEQTKAARDRFHADPLLNEANES